MGAANNSEDLPPIDRLALANSLEVTALLTQAMAKHGGHITFDEFMHIAMFAPGRGYYDSMNRIFGDGGDFTTAPEISPLFGQCIAQQIMQIMEHMGQTDVLEFGAGSGILAETILLELDKHERLPQTYYIHDISPSLRKRQFTRLQTNIPQLLHKVEWLNDIPTRFDGIMLGNEVLDALPVHRVIFRRNRRYTEIYVTEKNGRLVLEEGPLSSVELQHEMDRITQLWPDIADGYQSEINLGVKRWVAQVSQALGKGMILLIDYGFTRKEYYQPSNHKGNLMCYFQHHAHSNTMLYPGVQDVTCHVNFSLVAEAFQDQGLNIAGYTNQGFFLAGCGLEALYQQQDTQDEEKFLRLTRGIEQLIMPTAMGETFKVIGVTKNITQDTIGFSVSNLKDWL